MGIKKFLIIFGVLVILLFLLIGWMGWKGYKLQKGEISMITDRSEYEAGEILKVKIKNSFEENICFSSCYPYYLERKNEKWESYKYTGCYSFNGNGYCVGAQREKFFELTLPEIPVGTHRLAIPVCVGCKNAEEFREHSRFYSNEFIIK